jgi:hypothetical protein
MNPLDTTYTRYIHAQNRESKDALWAALLWQMYKEIELEISKFEFIGRGLAFDKIKEICHIAENKAEAVQMIRAYFSGPAAGVATPEFINTTFTEQWERTHTT